MPAPSQEAAAAVAELVETEFSTPPTDAPQEATPVAEQETEEQPEFDLTPELPDDLAQELAGPEDFSPEPEPVYEEEEEGEYEDPAVTAERNKRKALEKKVAWMEQQQLQANRNHWLEKDLPHFPALASFPKIAESLASSSASRRDFARKAKEQNDQLAQGMKAYVEKVVGNVDEVKKAKEQEMADAWGRPTAGPGYVPPEATEQAEAVDKIRKAGSLRDTIKARMEAGLRL